MYGTMDMGYRTIYSIVVDMLVAKDIWIVR